VSAVLTSPRSLSTPWRRALAIFGVVLALLLWLYRDTFGAMVGIWWRSETFAHAFLVAPISLWLIWRRRDRLATITPAALPWVLLPMAGAALVWLLGDLAGVNSVTQLAATALLVLAVPAVLGGNVARELTFPLCFLFFMVPIGEFLLPTLMTWTADFTVMALTFFGIPVYREGFQFVIPSGTWSVVEACSGVRYLIASFMVGTLFAYLNYRSTKRRVLFGIVSLVVPVVANWLRAVMIVMLGHLSGNRIATGVDHIIYGWIFFGIVVITMFFIGARWSQEPAPPPTRPADATAGPSAPIAWAMAALVAAVLALPHAAAWLLDSSTAAQPRLAMPALEGAPVAAGLSLPSKPVYEGASAQADQVYAVARQSVAVHVAYYRHQSYGHKLINSRNMLVSSRDQHWHQTASGATELRMQGRVVPLRTAELRAGAVGTGVAGMRLQVRQVYWVDGRFTTNDQMAVALGLLGQLSGHGDDAAALTFYMAGDDVVATAAALDRFVARHLPAFEAALINTRARR